MNKILTTDEMLKKHDIAIDRWPDTKLLIEKSMQEYAQQFQTDGWTDEDMINALYDGALWKEGKLSSKEWLAEYKKNRPDPNFTIKL